MSKPSLVTQSQTSIAFAVPLKFILEQKMDLSISSNHNSELKSESIYNLPVDSNAKLQLFKSPIYSNHSETDFTDIATTPNSDEESESDSDLSGIGFTNLLLQLSTCEETVFLLQKGYNKTKKLCDTSQGEIFEALLMDKSNPLTVQIKTCDKQCHKDGITYADDDLMQFLVEDDIIKEYEMLKYLSTDSNNAKKYISNHVDFFESATKYYLATSLEQQMSLQTFKDILNKCNKLKAKQYDHILKIICWKICSAIVWLHSDMNCALLNLNINSVRLENVEINNKKNGSISVNLEKISVKLSDVSKAVRFTNDNFSCDKFLIFDEDIPGVQYFSPKAVDEEIFDARAEDIWALGHVLYETIVGQPLYDVIDRQKCVGDGYWAVMTKNIRTYLKIKAKIKYVKPNMLRLLTMMLEPNENKRINSKDVLRCKWFKNCRQLVLQKQ